MPDAIQIRASSIPLAVKCPASFAPALKIDWSDDTGEVGTNVHRAIALNIAGHPLDGLNAEDEAMVEKGAGFLRDRMPGAEIELHLDDESGGGTIDAALSRRTDVIGTIADFKSGFREDDHWPQLYRYAYLLFQRDSWLRTINLNVVWLRVGAIDYKQVTREFIDSWWTEFARNVLGQADTFSPGEHCARCSRRVDCPALAAQMRQMAITLAGDPEISLDRSQIPAYRVKAKLFRQILDSIESRIRNEVILNGSIPLGGGKELRKVPMTIEKIKILPAWGALQEEFSDAELAEFVDVAKTKMLKAAAAKVVKGKAIAQEALMNKLRAAGAVTETESFQIRECPVRSEP